MPSRFSRDIKDLYSYSFLELEISSTTALKPYNSWSAYYTAIYLFSVFFSRFYISLIKQNSDLKQLNPPLVILGSFSYSMLSLKNFRRSSILTLVPSSLSTESCSQLYITSFSLLIRAFSTRMVQNLFHIVISIFSSKEKTIKKEVKYISVGGITEFEEV